MSGSDVALASSTAARRVQTSTNEKPSAKIETLHSPSISRSPTSATLSTWNVAADPTAARTSDTDPASPLSAIRCTSPRGSETPLRVAQSVSGGPEKGSGDDSRRSRPRQPTGWSGDDGVGIRALLDFGDAVYEPCPWLRESRLFDASAEGDARLAKRVPRRRRARPPSEARAANASATEPGSGTQIGRPVIVSRSAKEGGR